jgi:hypothetical protein
MGSVSVGYKVYHSYAAPLYVRSLWSDSAKTLSVNSYRFVLSFAPAEYSPGLQNTSVTSTLRPAGIIDNSIAVLGAVVTVPGYSSKGPGFDS